MRESSNIRRTKIIQFIDRIEIDRAANFAEILARAKMLKPEGFEEIEWGRPSWTVVSGRLTKLTGRNSKTATFNFFLSPKLGGTAMQGEWSDICKSMFLLRFHRKSQTAPNQRNFITAIGYVADAATKLCLQISTLTLEALDDACSTIAKHYASGSAYNIQKAVAEFAGNLDKNGLCRIRFEYRYCRMRRPNNTSGVDYVRLDDPVAAETKSEKLVDPNVFQIIGELYRNVPQDHKYRFYILMLSLLCCLGRRFSEISLLPLQRVKTDVDDLPYIEYFPRKQSQGDSFTPRRRLYMPTDVVPIVMDVFDELETSCRMARDTATEMLRSRDVDIRFLADITDDQRLYAKDLLSLGMSPNILSTACWFRQDGYTTADSKKALTVTKKPRHPKHYTIKSAVIIYCRRGFSGELLLPLHIDQNGTKTYLKDLLFVRHAGLSSGSYARWIASQCTHSMLTTFLRYLPELARSYASSIIEINFTSHHFRHTINTLLDEGGLSDLLQTRWFGRTNSRDTKAYQHSSREKRALMLREELRAGRVGGKFAEVIRSVPISMQEAILAVRIKAVHDIGPGLCIHHFSQAPCPRHLQCDADCDDYLYLKGDQVKVEEVKRRYAMARAARETAESMSRTAKPSNSIDWVAHNDKRLNTLGKQLADFGILDFDWRGHLKDFQNE